MLRQPPWTNQALVVYHGTLDTHTPSVLAGINLAKCDNDSDFGRGFYYSRPATIYLLSTLRKNPRLL